MKKRSKWPQEILKPKFRLDGDVEVTGLDTPLYGTHLGELFIGAENGNIGTVIGLSATEDSDGELVVLYRVLFRREGLSDFYTGLPAENLKSADIELCYTCVLYQDGECGDEIEPEPDGSCNCYLEDDGTWEVESA
jgi:hypothetical protein